MNLQLLSSILCKTFHSGPMCEDGRGGGVFSQVSAHRSYASFKNCGFNFGLSVLVDQSPRDDYVEATRLVATTGDTIIGDHTLLWIVPNRDGTFHEGAMIYEWLQHVPLRPVRDGLVTVEIRVKLRSQADFLPVDGNGFGHIVEKDTNDEQLSRMSYGLKRLRGKAVNVASRLRAKLPRQRRKSRLPWSGAGVSYETGHVPTEDLRDEALGCYEDLAEMGVSAAQAWCGEVYAMGLHGQPRDVEKSLRWLRSAIEANVTRAKYVMAVLMATAQGMAKDPGAAFRLCKDAASKGELDAQHMLGLMYERGDGMEQDNAQAAKWYQQAAQEGHPRARKALRRLRKKARRQ